MSRVQIPSLAPSLSTTYNFFPSVCARFVPDRFCGSNPERNFAPPFSLLVIFFAERKLILAGVCFTTLKCAAILATFLLRDWSTKRMQVEHQLLRTLMYTDTVDR